MLNIAQFWKMSTCLFVCLFVGGLGCFGVCLFVYHGWPVQAHAMEAKKLSFQNSRMWSL